MCAQTTRLSDRQLKAVKPKDKDYVLTDGNGLQLRVRVNRSLQWNFNYRHPVTKNRINMALGSYPEVSLAQARKKTVEARELLAQGIDQKLSAMSYRKPNERKRNTPSRTWPPPGSS
jgi:hypothetical protein